MLAGRKVGPRQPRSYAQNRATMLWVHSHPRAFHAWLSQQPKLPPGWTYSRGRLHPPKDWKWIDGKLTDPADLPPGYPLRPLPFQILYRPHKAGFKVTLSGRSWPRPGDMTPDPQWDEIVAWINAPGNLDNEKGKPTTFCYRRNKGTVAFWFRSSVVAMRFFLAFGLLPGAQDRQ